jgi:hypothetical protein
MSGAVRDELGGEVRRRAIPSPADSLLTWCARRTMPPDLVPELRRRARVVAAWDPLLDLAEQHGLGPLLCAHVRPNAPELPPQVGRQLTALLFRHRRINAVMLKALVEVLDALDDVGIESRVLKGPALIPLVYGDAGLRPITDLDVLVPVSQAIAAQKLLARMGFAARIPTSMYRMMRLHHLYSATREVDGVPVTVEIHLDGLSADRGARLPFDGRVEQTMTVELGGRRVSTLAPPLMLWHLCRHMTGLRHPFRLIWAADIVGFAEAFVDQLDWDYVRSVHPHVISTLALLHFVTPVPERVLQCAGVVPARMPQHVAEDYAGWPRSSAFVPDGWAERVEFVSQTLGPPEWWLRLNYGCSGKWGRWTGTLRHLAALSGIAGRRTVDLLPRVDRHPEDSVPTERENTGRRRT